VVRNYNPVAFGKAAGIRAGLDHVADDFMAEHGARRGGPGLELEQVGSAQAGDSQAQHDLAIAGARHRPRLQFGPVAAEADNGGVAGPLAGL